MTGGCQENRCCGRGAQKVCHGGRCCDRGKTVKDPQFRTMPEVLTFLILTEICLSMGIVDNRERPFHKENFSLLDEAGQRDATFSRQSA